MTPSKESSTDGNINEELAQTIYNGVIARSIAPFRG